MRGFGYALRAHPRSLLELSARIIECDYLHGLDLDIVLSDYTLDILEPADRESQVIDLPQLTTEERARVIAEYQVDMTRVEDSAITSCGL